MSLRPCFLSLLTQKKLNKSMTSVKICILNQFSKKWNINFSCLFSFQLKHIYFLAEFSKANSNFSLGLHSSKDLDIRFYLVFLFNIATEWNVIDSINFFREMPSIENKAGPHGWCVWKRALTPSSCIHVTADSRPWT